MYTREKREEIIQKSHKRSAEYGIEKERVSSRKILKADEVSKNIEINKGLIKIAEPFMKVLYDFLMGSGFFIILTDREGCILNVVGDRNVEMAAAEMNMVVGAYMDEKSIGTNAMGTAISENSPIQISATEHFIAAYHKWTCSAAPIHSENGEIVGTLNLTGSSDLVHPHTLGLVVAAVESIENQMKSEIAKDKLLEINGYMSTIIQSISTGLLTIDNSGKIKMTNRNACIILGQEEENIVGRMLVDLIPNCKDINKVLETGRSCLDEEIVINRDGIRERYNLNVFPITIEDQKTIGCVVMLKEIQRVINLINKYTGMRARYTFEDIIGKSKEINKIINYSMGIADSPSTVLIQGESGTGKEVLAQAIHNYSSRKDNGFVAINCGAIAKNLIESELFGYDDGAFTGAKRGGHPGKFELANGGTLFLDEIGEMPLDMQVNLLRVLQEGAVTRVGGTKYIPVNVRVIAATNKNLKKEVAAGKFREDLYYRLSVIPISLPPLRERKEDIPLLVDYFLKIKSKRLSKAIPKIDHEIYKNIFLYSWPGNIRELENYIENIVNLNGNSSYVLNQENTGSAKDELSYVNSADKTYDGQKKAYEEQFICSLEELEKKAIIAILNKFGGNVSKAAKILGVSRNTLYTKMKKYELEDC
jgi:PAS domain S-box-containing protein